MNAGENVMVLGQENLEGKDVYWITFVLKKQMQNAMKSYK